MKNKRITVIGCGRWGSGLAHYISSLGYDCLMYGRADSKSYIGLSQTHKNEYLTLPDTVRFTSDLTQALEFSEKIIISINAQKTPELFDEIAETGIINKIFVLCMKGLIEDSGQRLSEVACGRLDYTSRVAVWVGPGHVENFVKKIPSCMVISSSDTELAGGLCAEFSSELIRLYLGEDLIGTEIGAAAKNVIGICAGMLDGVKLSTLKGPLMARGSAEVARLAEAMGGERVTVYGLSHIGDYEATLFSPHSHNRAYGEAFVNGKRYEHSAEGVATSAALVKLGEKYGVDMPICRSVYEVLYNGADPMCEIENMFGRTLKAEFQYKNVLNNGGKNAKDC